MISMSLWGKYYPELENFEWLPLWQMDEQDKADLELKNSQRDLMYLQEGVITHAQVAENLRANKVYKNIDEEHINNLKDIERSYDENLTEEIKTEVE